MYDHDDYVIFDLETTITNGDPSAFVPENKVVLAGSKYKGTFRYFFGYPPTHHPLEVVGHNVAFDLAYCIREYGTEWFSNFVRDGGSIWDTQIAEYVLSGQTIKMSKLDDLSLKYGGTLKDSRVSDAFAAGKGADEIDIDVLKDYLQHDLDNTERVYLAQRKAAIEAGQYELIKVMCHARLMTLLMQYTGMNVDVEGLLKWRSKLDHEYAEYTEAIARPIRAEIEKCKPREDAVLDYPDGSLCTNYMLSAYIFGGAANITWKLPDGEYKTGKKAGTPKHKNVVIPCVFERKVTPFMPTKSSAGYSLIHPMDDDVLSTLVPFTGGGVGKLANNVLLRRRTEKLMSTYIDGVLKNVYPDGKVHPNYNHALTATGRLSCSNPNLQNQDADVKKYYLPDEGKLFLEVDFKQLEVCGLAQLSGDPQLIADIRDNVDLHYETGRVVFGWKTPADMDDVTRRGVKGVNFGLIYGGTAKGLAKTTGFDEDVVRKLINAFYSRYPRVKEWQLENIDKVKEGRVYDGVTHTQGGYPAGYSMLKLDTGRRFVFKEYDAPDWLRDKGEVTSFSPTEIKNYPVQGFATGDVVPLTLAVFLETWAKNPKLFTPCNTVHDSIMVMVNSKDDAKKVVAVIENEVLPTVVGTLRDVWGIDMQVPLRIDAKVGKDWKNMDKL